MEKLNLVKSTFDELPNNIEAEQAVLGSVLISNEIFDEINTIISNINFFDPMHQKIFSAIENLIYKGMLANPITLKNYFENNEGLKELGGQEYLIKITKFATSVKQAVDYANIVQEMEAMKIPVVHNLSDYGLKWENVDDIINDFKQALDKI